MKRILLNLNLDHTVWDKRDFDDICFAQVSAKNFWDSFMIQMTTHPVTGEQDKEYAKHTNEEIWRYKIQQVLEDQKSIRYCAPDALKEISSVEEVDLEVLARQVGEHGLDMLLYETPETFRSSKRANYIRPYASPEDLQELHRQVDALGIVSAGQRALQERILQLLNYVPESLCAKLSTYGGEEPHKQAMLKANVHKYQEMHARAPEQLWYVGDAPQDMKAVHTVQGIRTVGVGVLTGMASEEELRNAGANYIIPKLNNGGVITLAEYLEDAV